MIGTGEAFASFGFAGNVMKNKTTKMERRAFLKSGAKLIPALAAIGVLATTIPARADDCSNSCSGSCYKGCTGSCMEGCTGSCMEGCTGGSK